MAKEGKLTKLKSVVIKKWHSFGKLSRSSSSISAANSSDNEDIIMTSSSSVATNLQPVYVGNSRRRYLVSADVIVHPLFQELVGKANGTDDLIIKCEVVLFEHLLWMIENADPQPESLDELVQFYAC